MLPRIVARKLLKVNVDVTVPQGNNVAQGEICCKLLLLPIINDVLVFDHNQTLDGKRVSERRVNLNVNFCYQVKVNTFQGRCLDVKVYLQIGCP